MPVTVDARRRREIAACTQSLSCPASSVDACAADARRARRFAARSSAMRSGSVSGGSPSTNVFSGPSTRRLDPIAVERDRQRGCRLP